jgi:3-hydroxymyristoyl/3-hydroxydecanoyl-(acyl carrier protein) dehydratase
LDRIVAVDGQPFVLRAGCAATAEYDVPADAWYFAANRQPVMPFAVLLEIALQPCGWLAAYAGSALTSSVDLSFRNLGGRATQHRAVGPGIGTLATQVKMTKVSQSGGMVIQHYDFTVRAGDELVYAGDTYFGFFTKAALANQVGIRDAGPYTRPTAEAQAANTAGFPAEPPFPDRQLRMLDDASWAPGGPHGLGSWSGRKRVDPAEWFFKAHFHQDPVCPGSLGLEAMTQLMRLAAWERWGSQQVQTPTLGREHQWTYRGQVLPTDREVVVQMLPMAFDDAAQTVTADGWLSVDGRHIYRMAGFTLEARRQEA